MPGMGGNESVCNSDFICDGNETYWECPLDCLPTCINGVCDVGEDLVSCAQDCVGGCGDGSCTPGETATSCPADCQDLTRRSSDGARAPRKIRTKPTTVEAATRRFRADAAHRKQMHELSVEREARRAKQGSRRTTTGGSHQDSDMFTQWSCRDRDWTRMAERPLDICGVDECKQRPYPCEHTSMNCIDRDITKSGTVTCWLDECRVNNPCSKDEACFDPDVFELDSALTCTDKMERPWGKNPAYEHCTLEPWEVITRRLLDNTLKFETSSLGKLKTPNVNTWVCVEGHECAFTTGGAPADSSHFCFVYQEDTRKFISWGTAAETKLLYNATACSSTTVF